MCFASVRIVASDARRHVVSFVVVGAGADGCGGGGDGVLALGDVGSPPMEDALRTARTSSAVSSSYSGSSSSVSSASPGVQAPSVASAASRVGVHPVGSARTIGVADRSATMAMIAIASVFTAVSPPASKLPESSVAQVHAGSACRDQELCDDVG
jgi:hypothetical protein